MAQDIITPLVFSTSHLWFNHPKWMLISAVKKHTKLCLLPANHTTKTALNIFKNFQLFQKHHSGSFHFLAVCSQKLSESSCANSEFNRRGRQPENKQNTNTHAHTQKEQRYRSTGWLVWDGWVGRRDSARQWCVCGRAVPLQTRLPLLDHIRPGEQLGPRAGQSARQKNHVGRSQGARALALIHYQCKTNMDVAFI